MHLVPSVPHRRRTTPAPPHEPTRSRRLLGLLLGGATALSLLPALALPASAADPVAVAPCPGPGQTIVEGQGGPAAVEVGTTKTQRLRFELHTRTGCGASGATAEVRTPQGTRTVRLQEVERDEERVRWAGSLAVTPRSLRNEDAGRWRTTYRVTGADPDSYRLDSSVRRAVRITFNAGPEPVRRGRITFSGHLERASWDTGTYRDLAGRTVGLYAIRLDEEDMEEFAAVRTGADGRYRLTRPYPGPAYYQAVYDGTRYTADRWSRRDRVDTPR